jgi:aryl-alcohol dehydrogenase-like predicted oxidoreductase
MIPYSSLFLPPFVHPPFRLTRLPMLSSLPKVPSALCLGGVSFGLPELDDRATFALLDHFTALGGNFIDTAHMYSDWIPGEKNRSERVLGDWLRDRGNREKIILATKGMHPALDRAQTRRSSAAEIRDDLEGSLRVLRVETIDLYWLHRDDPARPVSHFIDLLNTFLREGKIRNFGASNWTADRLREAHRYALASGQVSFSANQPYWALGILNAREPAFMGAVRFDAGMDSFHRETGIAVVPYSSQAKGFYSLLALPLSARPAGFEKHEYHVAANLALGKLVLSLARRHDVPPVAIALAYLRQRPYPVFPIIGSTSLPHTTESFTMLRVTLTPAELAQLESASASGLPVGT